MEKACVAAVPIQDWTHSMSPGFGTPTVDTESTPPHRPQATAPLTGSPVGGPPTPPPAQAQL